MAKDPASLAALNRLLAATEPMVKGGIRAVPGEGPLNPDIAFVGEQPGDQEDLAGKPFVGPAGKLLDKAMAEAGIDRPGYITIHPSFLLRMREEDKKQARKSFVADLKHIRKLAEREKLVA